jgi:primosomal protein N' (replication factor Y)
MHPLLQSLRGDGYSAFAEQALQERQQAQLPPYASLVLVRAEAAQREAVFDFLNQAQRLASELANTPAPNPDSDPQPMPITVLGPVAAPMERRSGRYRAQLLLQCTHRGTLHALLTPFVDGISAMKTARKVRWSLDVDPQEML